MKIDICAHIFPPKYRAQILKRVGEKTLPLIQINPSLTDLETRFRIVDKYNDVIQVLVPTGPPLEAVASPKETVEIARIANDEMAELVFKYPDRLASAVAILPISSIDDALKEADRAITQLKFRGVFMWTPIYTFDPQVGKYEPTRGRPIDLPELMPLYEKMASYDLPIWLHPHREPRVSDYSTEQKSKYQISHVFGWPYETTVAMARLVFSGVLEKYPKLKFITHHCGGMVPYFEQRIVTQYDHTEMRYGAKYKQGLTKSPIDYFRMFYNDTATNGSTPALMCAYAFFGAEHLLFGTDMPYDSQLGNVVLRKTIDSIEQMTITDSEKRMIFEDNARRLLRLAV
jgi:predicted TIM-barrel fold metal-dependent hydrolase